MTDRSKQGTKHKQAKATEEIITEW